MPRHGHQAQLGRMLELPVARPLPVQIPAVGLDELDDLADRHGLAQRRVSGIGIRVQRSSLPVTLQGVLHLRRLTIARRLATIRFPFRVADRWRLESSREGMIEGFSLGNHMLLLEYTGRLFREGKAVISGELAGSSSGGGATPRTGRRGCRSWPQAGCWAVSSLPGKPGCGKSPSVWACTTWRTWAARGAMTPP